MRHSGNTSRVADPHRVLLGLAIGWGVAGIAHASSNPGRVLGDGPCETVVFSSEFESGLPAEMSGAGSVVGVEGYQGLGQDGSFFAGMLLRNDTGVINVPATATVLTLTDLPPHSAIDVHFLLAVIDSCDGEDVIDWTAPDAFALVVDGETVFQEELTNLRGIRVQDYEPPAMVPLTPLPPTADRGWNSQWPDSAYDMRFEPRMNGIAHTASDVTIEFVAVGAGWQGGADESWGIDNVEIRVREACGADFNADGELNVLDFVAFQLA